MTTQEAVDLLRKWRDENRVIHAGVAVNGVFAKVLGVIDAVDGDVVRLSAARSNDPLGRANLIEFPLAGSRFQFSDASDVPEPLRTTLRGYDSTLSIYRAGEVYLSLAVLPPLSELGPAS